MYDWQQFVREQALNERKGQVRSGSRAVLHHGNSADTFTVPSGSASRGAFSHSLWPPPRHEGVRVFTGLSHGDQRLGNEANREVRVI